MAVVMAAIVVVTATGTASAAQKQDHFSWKTKKAKHGYITRFYDGKKMVCKIKTRKKIKVKLKNFENITNKTVSKRKNKYLLVGMISGQCVNAEGRGETDDGYYISYRGVKGCKPYKCYHTYCVFANNNGEDDIICRVDYEQ